MRLRNPNSWMWAEALELLQDAERLQRQFFRIGVADGAPCWEPPVDLYETAGELWLLVALPGVTAQQLEVMLAPGQIVVRGERSLPANSRRAAIHRLEIPYGRFERRISLPEGGFEMIDQRLEHGCLVLTLHRLT
ncbi:MAG: Hsp20/alpha crystallin family protein [Burkholderiales bacterium]|nr:Hsp20/alpha crystallin family protein [Burkholderiales bacterium]